MAIIVTGASGLLGSALVGALREQGGRVIRLVRRAPQGEDESFWQPAKGLVDPAALDGAEAVVHLAGAGIGDKRWTDSYKREIYDSRVDGTRTLVTALNGLSRPPQVLVSASGVGFYGDTGDHPVDESGPRGEGFLAELCERWEGEARAAGDSGIRTAQLRTGLVLSGKGGALRQMLPIFKMGLGAPLASGRQYWSWITVDDWVGAVLHVLRNRQVEGPVNLTGPAPVTNADFTKALGRALRRPTMPIPVPEFALRLGLGEFAGEGLVFGQRALPAKLIGSGYSFRHTGLDEALAAVL